MNLMWYLVCFLGLRFIDLLRIYIFLKVVILYWIFFFSFRILFVKYMRKYEILIRVMRLYVVIWVWNVLYLFLFVRIGENILNMRIEFEGRRLDKWYVFLMVFFMVFWVDGFGNWFFKRGWIFWDGFFFILIFIGLV